MYVQFEDETNSKIVTILCGPQDPEFWKNVVEVEDDDPLVVEFLDGQNKINL